MTQVPRSSSGALAGLSTFLPLKASYGPFEMQTLRFRMAEAKQKLHLVRKFVYNRRIASTVSRLRVWLTVIWPTLSFGLAEVGLSGASALPQSLVRL